MHESFYICTKWYVFVITQKTTICFSRLLEKWQRKNVYHEKWSSVFKMTAIIASENLETWKKWKNLGGDLESFVCKNRKNISDLSNLLDAVAI